MARRSVPRSQRQYVIGSSALRLVKGVAGARPAPFPGFVPPALATLWGKPPSGARWVHELKYDGYRAQLHVQDAGTRVLTRRGHDWTKKFGSIAAAAGGLQTHAAIIDGEVVVLTPEGLTDFGALQDDLGAGRTDRLVFFAFDLLYLDAFDLRGAGLINRKRVLAELLGGASGSIRYSEHLTDDGSAVLRSACALQAEGIVSKIADSPYRSERSELWVKVTCRQRDTFPVVGFAEKNGKFDGLYLGRRQGGKLVYAGKVEHGFTDADAKSVREKLRPLITRAKVLHGAGSRPKAKWVKPVVLAEVEFRALTGDGRLRHPSFKGLREDIEPDEL